MQADSLPSEPQGKPKNTGMGSLSLLQRIFPTQESNWGLLHRKQILYQLSFQENTSLATTQEMPTRGHHQIVSTKIMLIIFFAASDGEVLYSQLKQDLELAVAQIISSLLQNSGFKLKKVGKTTRPFRYE